MSGPAALSGRENECMSRQSEVLKETVAARERAVELLKTLREARENSERRMAEQNQSDALKKVTGRSAMDNAIESTQRMIDSLERSVETLKRDMSEEELAELDAGKGNGE